MFFRAVLEKIDGRRANFTEAKLVGVNFVEACLMEASFYKAELRGAVLTKYAVWHPEGPMIKVGCFWGNLVEFEKRVRNHSFEKAMNIVPLYQV